MDFDKIFNNTKIILNAVSKSVERIERRKAREAANKFVINAIITSIISIVLSLILPYWLAGIILILAALIRFIGSYGNIETAVSARKLLKTTGIWTKKNDQILISAFIPAIIVFIVIQIIKFVSTPRKPFITSALFKFIGENINEILNIILIIGVIVLLTTFIVSICKKNAKYIVISIMLFCPFIIPMLGINFLEVYNKSEYIAVIASKDILQKIIFYALIGLFISATANTIYKKNLITLKHYIFFLIISVFICISIYYNYIPEILNTINYYKDKIFPNVNIIFVIIGALSTILLFSDFISCIFNKNRNFSDFLNEFFISLILYGFIFGISLLKPYMHVFFASVAGIGAGSIPLCIYYSIKERVTTYLIPIYIILPIICAIFGYILEMTVFGFIFGIVLDFVIFGIAEKEPVIAGFPFMIIIPVVSIAVYMTKDPFNMFGLWSFITGLCIGVLIDTLIISIYTKDSGFIKITFAFAIILLIPIFAAYIIGGFLAVLGGIIISVIAAFLILFFIGS